MARTPTEHIRELQLEVRALQERDEYRDRDFQRVIQETEDVRKQVAELHRENAVLRQQVQDHIARCLRRSEVHGTRTALLVGLVNLP
jgi:FtsZ-binding cell division protein ZapB